MYDLSNVPDFEGLPVGIYPVKIYDYKPVTNEDTGNEGIEFKVKNEGGQTGRYTVWTTKENGRAQNLIGLKKIAKVCGVSDEEMKHFQPAMLAGCKFMATVQVKKDKPQYTNIVRADPMPPGEVGVMSPTQQTAAIAPRQPQPPAPATNTNDDLPF